MLGNCEPGVHRLCAFSWPCVGCRRSFCLGQRRRARCGVAVALNVEVGETDLDSRCHPGHGDSEVRCSAAVPASPYPPPQSNQAPANQPAQNERAEYNARDRAPVHHEIDSGADACRVSGERAIKLPSCDPRFAPGREQTGHDEPNHREQEGENLPAFHLRSARATILFGDRPRTSRSLVMGCLSASRPV